MRTRFGRCKRVVTLSPTSQHKDGEKPTVRGREAKAFSQVASLGDPLGLHAHGGASLLPRGADTGKVPNVSFALHFCISTFVRVLFLDIPDALFAICFVLWG